MGDKKIPVTARPATAAVRPGQVRAARLTRLAVPVAAVAGLASAAVVGLPTAAGATPLCTGLGTTVTCVYTAVGTDTFTVPAGVTSLDVTAAGGAGGNGSGTSGGTGGTGARVQGTVAVVAGDLLTVVVGGHGGNGGATTGGTGGAGAGTGGAGGGTGPGGGGGGGSSDVSLSGVPQVVGPGGGGGGGTGVTCTAITTEGNGGNGTLAGNAGSVCTGTTGGTGGTAGGSGTAGGTVGANGGTATSGAGGGGGGGLLGGLGGGAGDANAQGGGGGGGSKLGTLIGQGSAGANGSVTIVYTAPAVSITTTSPLPNGTIGHLYSTTLNATGGLPPYRWSRVSGGLPRGLSLHSGGTISGTPVAYGSYTYTARVTDSASNTATKTFSITIVPHADLAVSLTHNGIFRTGQQGTYTIRVTNTGTQATSTAATNTVWFTVPAGLVVTFGGQGTWWQCSKQRHSSMCTRNGAIGAGASTTITVTVTVTAGAGTSLQATAKVAPTDATWHDNTSFNTVTIRG